MARLPTVHSNWMEVVAINQTGTSMDNSSHGVIQYIGLTKKMLWKVTVCLACAIAAVLVYNRRMTADKVGNDAATALMNYNIKKLLSLSSPEELRTLNLNEKNVGDYLSETYVATPNLVVKKIERVDHLTPDLVQYNIKFTNYKGVIRPLIWVNETPNFGWRLNLSSTLKVIGQASANSMDIVENSQFAESLMKKHGIKGVYSNMHGYMMFNK